MCSNVELRLRYVEDVLHVITSSNRSMVGEITLCVVATGVGDKVVLGDVAMQPRSQMLAEGFLRSDWILRVSLTNRQKLTTIANPSLDLGTS